MKTQASCLSCRAFSIKDNNFTDMNNFVLLVVVIIIAILIVAAAIGIAKLIAPRSYNPQKGEAYECGIPTRGKSWMQFKVGYYLFAILFLMFDVETVFLFAWAVVVQDLGIYGLLSVLFFLLILVLGLAYAWRKGALEWK
jgi:NADH-quinone oxidoreductase subunit A